MELKENIFESSSCKYPKQEGKGSWIAEDRTFGLGLNIPRTRHASEILKTKVQILYDKLSLS